MRNGQINKKALQHIVVLNIVLFILVFSGCVSQGSQSKFNAELAKQRLDEALVKASTDENGHIYRNTVIRIDAPDYGFSYANAAGIARVDTGEAMTIDHQFTIASVGKTMTSVIMLQLLEEGALGEKGLDATLMDLNAFPPEVLGSLHKINGVSYGHEITVRQLLNQTSGLKDVLMDDEHGIGNDYPKEYRGYAPASLNGVVVFDKEKGFEAMMRCIEKGIPAGCSLDDYYLSYTWPHWDYQAWVANPTNKMAGLLNFYMGGMNETALWKPGTAFHYADTNYIILGLLIEKLTGNSLHQELRTRIFDPLGMNHTYLAYSTNPSSEMWESQLSDHWGSNVPLITNGLNLSMDWGAGGEISTVQDLSKFTRAVATGKLFQHQSTLKEMISLPDGIEQPFYAAGIIPWPTGDGLILHHNGAPGSWIEYHTAYNLSIVGTINDLDRPDRFMTLRGDIYSALAEAGLRSSNLKTGATSMNLLTVLSGELPMVLLSVFVVSLLIFVLTLVVWFIELLRKRNGNKNSPLPASIARYLAFSVIVLDLSFLIGFILKILSNPVQLMFGYNSSVISIFFLPLLSLVLTVGLIIFTIMAWKDSFWSVTRRIHYTLLMLATLVFLWTLNNFGLLILP